MPVTILLISASTRVLTDAVLACPDCLSGRLARGEIWNASSLLALAAVLLPFVGSAVLAGRCAHLWPRRDAVSPGASERAAP